MSETTKRLYDLALDAQSAEEIAKIAEGAGIPLADGEGRAPVRPSAR